MSEPDTKFSYDGRLVFNGIYTTSVQNPNFDFNEIVKEELVDFSQGSIDSPGRGYSPVPFRRMVLSESKVAEQIKNLIEGVHAVQYREEEWEYQEVKINGEMKEAPTKTGESSFDAFWSQPDYLFVRGNKTEAKRAGNLLSSTLNQYLNIAELDFSPDFFLWLFSKEKHNQELPSELSIKMLTDAQFEGDERDLFGQQGQVEGSIDVTKSTPVLMGILRQMGINQLEGVFSISGVFVRARISINGRVQVFADNAIKGSPDIERMATSIAFIKEFTNLFNKWQQMKNEDKFPPKQFFTDIYKECQRQGVEIKFSIDDVIREYEEKGCSTEYEQYQTGFDEF